MSKTGVAFSGGGIRSAALCSGVLRRLLQRGVEADYLSCVSGGGYTGTAYVDWKYRHEQKDDPSWHKRFFEHMRIRAGLLCDWQRPLCGVLDTLVVIGLVLYVSLITPFIVWGSYACPLAYVIKFLFGPMLIAPRCEDQEKMDHSNSTVSSEARCAIRQGTRGYDRLILFAVTLALFLFFYSWTKVLDRLSGIAHLLSSFFGLLFAVTFGPWFIHDFLDTTPRFVQVAVVIFSIIMWFFAPVLRRKASMVLIVYVLAYVVYWHVYEQPIAGVEHSKKAFRLLLSISVVSMCFVPLIGSFQARLVHIYNRWHLQKAFYTDESIGKCGCAGIGFGDLFLGTHVGLSKSGQHQRLPSEEAGALCLADLQPMKPHYISNTVANEWKDDRADKSKYDLLTMSPTEIERIGSKFRIDEFAGRMGPEDVKLSDAMATSAAAVSTHMGSYEDSAEAFQHIQTILGLGMGASMVSDVAFEKREHCCLKVLPYVIQTVFVAPLITIPIVYFTGGDDNYLIAMAVVVFFIFVFLLTAASMISTGQENPSNLEKMARWLLVHVPHCRYMRDLVGITNTGPVPPAILRLSDGGHIENLALLPLLKRRLQRIVVVNGGHTASDSAYADDLVHALGLARDKLNCYFISSDGRDVIQDVKDKFVRKPPGEQPRSYRFKVDYYERADSDTADRKVGEGEILLIAPRHPNNGVHTSERVTWKEALRDIDVDLEAELWGAGPEVGVEEAERLTFCCCECCHARPCCGISKSLCGVFPQHKTANQFFTPAMFSAYHREGYRASVEAGAAEFLGATTSVEMSTSVSFQSTA